MGEMEKNKIVEIIELVNLDILPLPDFLIIPISYQKNVKINKCLCLCPL